MMQQDIPTAQGFKHGLAIVADMHLTGSEFRIFQVRPRGFIVELKQPLKIDDTRHAEHQRFIEIKDRDQAVDNFRVRASFYFEPDRIALAALRHLRVNRFEQRPRLFLLEIKVAVSGNAERSGR